MSKAALEWECEACGDKQRDESDGVNPPNGWMIKRVEVPGYQSIIKGVVLCARCSEDSESAAANAIANRRAN
jgi:hypothetical protein